MNRWWRAYDGAVDDPKLQLLPDHLFKAWFNLLCLASGNGGALPSVAIVAWKLHLSEDKAKHTIAELVARQLLDEVDGRIEPHNWRGRQYISDVTDPTAANRMRRYRNRQRNATVTDTVTPTVTVTPPRDRVQRQIDIEAEASISADKVGSQKRGRKPKPYTEFPEGWTPQNFSEGERLEFAKFEAHSRKRGDEWKDWEQAWRSWKLKAPEFYGGKPNGSHSGQTAQTRHQPTLADAFDKVRQRMGIDQNSDAHVGLPQGRLPRPGGFHRDDGSNSRGLRSGDSRVCDEPQDGDST